MPARLQRTLPALRPKPQRASMRLRFGSERPALGSIGWLEQPDQVVTTGIQEIQESVLQRCSFRFSGVFCKRLRLFNLRAERREDPAEARTREEKYHA